MNANRQESSKGVTEKGRTDQPIKSDILNYSHASDKIGDIEESEIRDDTVTLSRSKRKLKIRINKGKKGKKGSRKPRILDKLNTKKNRENLRDGVEELLDDDDYENFQTEMPLEQLNLELIKAVKRSNLNKVTEYINQGADINTKDNTGKTPLHIASKRGYLDITEVLLDKGAKVDAQENNGQEPIHLAAARGRLDVVKYLVEKGADVDAYQGGGGYSTVLHFAARKGHLDTVKYLIEKGANPDAKDGDGKTPLERAEQRGISHIVEYLKDKVKQVTEVPQTTERQLVTTEIQNVTTNISQTTEEQQVTTEIQNVTTNMSQTTESWDTTDGQQVINGKGNTSIHIAAREGDLNAVKYFVENGADVNLKDKFDETPLHLASRFDRLDVVKYLVEKGANVNIEGGYLKNTPLHEAVDNGSLELVKYLKENGAGINVTNKSVKTPLHLAAYNGKLDIAKYLIDSRAKLRAIDEYGNTPLHAAARGNNFGIVKYIADIDYYDWSTRADINAKNNYGETPLHIAARKGNLSIVKYLVKEKHAYTYRQDENGNTPLHLAVKSHNSNIASFLVEQGANLEIRNKDGKTPIDLSYTKRRRRDISNNSWKKNSFIDWVKDSISSTRSPGLLTSGEHNNYTITAVPEMNTFVMNSTIILGILSAGLFNKTQCKHPIHGNLLSPREQLMRNIEDSNRILEQSLRKGKEKGWDIPNIDMENIEFSSNKTGYVEK